MSLFSRVHTLWIGFWSRLVSSSEDRHKSLVAHGALQQQKQQLERLRNAMTNLVYQRRRLDGQLQQVEREASEAKADLEQAVRDDRDELAMHLIGHAERLGQEATFLREQVTSLNREIAVARETETVLRREIEQGEQTIGTLTSRYQALRVRKELRTEMRRVTAGVDRNVGKGASPLADQIARLEAELETVDAKHEKWHEELREMREDRQKVQRKMQLEALKRDIRSRALPTHITVTTP